MWRGCHSARPAACVHDGRLLDRALVHLVRAPGGVAAARTDQPRRKEAGAALGAAGERESLASLHALHDRRADAGAIAIEYHAVAADDREACARHLTLAGAMLQLPHRLDRAVHAARRARLAGRQQPARGVDGKAALADVGAGEADKVVAGNEPEVIELRQHHRRVVVVDRREIDVLRVDAGGRPQVRGDAGQARAQAFALLVVVA